jgi:ABC-2 type transport system permease protein
VTSDTKAVRRYGAINVLGLWTLYLKEVRRFLKVFTQTIVAPVVTTLLFLAIFSLALGRTAEISGAPYATFLAPGLVMAAVMQQAFANTSSSLIIAKIQGNIVDVLMPPLSPGELTIGFALGGMTRGILVALATMAALYPFAPWRIVDLGAVIFFGAAGSLLMSLVGVAAGIWSDKFDQLAAVTNFVVTPLAFLSGTFYSVEALPPFWHDVAHANPFFYLIDGFRSGFTGKAEAPFITGVAVLIAANLALWAVCHVMFRRGYKLKA